MEDNMAAADALLDVVAKTPGLNVILADNPEVISFRLAGVSLGGDYVETKYVDIFILIILPQALRI